MEGWKHKDLKSKDFDSIKELFDKAFTRVNMFVDFRTKLVEDSLKRAGEELEKKSTKKQKVDEDKDTSELQSLMEVIPDKEEVVIDVVPLATKSPSIVDWKIHKEGKKSYYQIVRADGKSQMYRRFVQIEDEIWKLQQRYQVLSWKLYDSCGVHSLRMQHMHIHMLGRIVGIKSFLMLFGITTVLIDVNAAQSKLVLLENFNENYSKCLRLLVKLQLRFFPPALFDRILGEIHVFSQHENESLTDAWLRMKEMLLNCHGHNLSKCNIIKTNYHGLSEITQEVLNTAAGGIFLYKTPNQAYQLLKNKVLLKLDWAKNQKTKSSPKKTIAFADEGNSNTDTDKIMARMDAMTIKMDAQYKELQSRAKQPPPDLDDDDMPTSHEEEAKFMQIFRKTRFYNDYRD
ncbi:hypothetical protein Tco_0955816 [Tanacetum coccineum]|uniref:Reverse transcriptase domain-containing protein n=1 Tax=Tanacetum coccineum TaxID=301880 RepID=A0ABQ5E884_9ASTR